MCYRNLQIAVQYFLVAAHWEMYKLFASQWHEKKTHHVPAVEKNKKIFTSIAGTFKMKHTWFKPFSVSGKK